jgi:hypothetical protein
MSNYTKCRIDITLDFLSIVGLMMISNKGNQLPEENEYWNLDLRRSTVSDSNGTYRSLLGHSHHIDRVIRLRATTALSPAKIGVGLVGNATFCR